METQQLVGMTEADAVQTIKAAGFTARITRREKQSFRVTMEYNTGRINLEIDNGKVTKSKIG